MATTVQILTTNYSGESATITFSPCSGGTINLGTVTVPYNYISDNYLGDYSLYFADFDQTCTFSIPCLATPTPTATDNPTPTPTIVVTATPVATATPTPTATDIPPTPTPTGGVQCYSCTLTNNNDTENWAFSGYDCCHNYIANITLLPGQHTDNFLIDDPYQFSSFNIDPTNIVVYNCSGSTPTPTSTNSSTPTPTATDVPAPTATPIPPTPTAMVYTYGLNTTENPYQYDACQFNTSTTLVYSTDSYPQMGSTIFYTDPSLTTPYHTTNDGYYSTLFAENGDVFALTTDTTTGVLVDITLCITVPTPTATNEPTPTPTPAFTAFNGKQFSGGTSFYCVCESIGTDDVFYINGADINAPNTLLYFDEQLTQIVPNNHLYKLISTDGFNTTVVATVDETGYVTYTYDCTTSVNEYNVMAYPVSGNTSYYDMCQDPGTDSVYHIDLGGSLQVGQYLYSSQYCTPASPDYVYKLKSTDGLYTTHIVTVSGTTGTISSVTDCTTVDQPTATPAPTNTPTPTATNSLFADTVYWGVNAFDACNNPGGTIGVGGNGTTFCNSTTFTSNAFYSFPTGNYVLAYNGDTVNISVTNGNQNATMYGGGCQACVIAPTATPTPTSTPVPDPTSTPTPTPTATDVPPTSTPTQTPTPTPTPTSTQFQTTTTVNISSVDLNDACSGGDYGQQTITFIGSSICDATSIITVPALILSDTATNGNIYVFKKTGPNFDVRHFRRDGSGNTFSPVSACVDCASVAPTPTPTATDVPPTPTPTATDVPPTPTSTPTQTPTPTPTPTATDVPPTATPTNTPTPTPTATVSVSASGYYATTAASACTGPIRGISGNFTGNTTDFCTSTSFTGNTFAYQSTGTYYLAYGGNTKQISITFGSNVVTSSGGCTACPAPTAVPTSTPTATPTPTQTPTPTPTPTATPDQTPNWINNGSYGCYSTCNKYNVQVDNNVNSLTYNTTRQGSLVESNSTYCGGCCGQSTAAVWTNEGAAYCDNCVSKQTQRDTNTCSSTYNQTRVINSGSACDTSQSWVNNGSYTCSGCDKHYVEVQNNPCATGYGTTRTGGLVESNSTYCGGCCGQSTAPIWVNTTTECVGYSLYHVQEDQNSCSSSYGDTRRGDLIENNSAFCGYTPPPTPTPTPTEAPSFSGYQIYQSCTNGQYYAVNLDITWVFASMDSYGSDCCYRIGYAADASVYSPIYTTSVTQTNCPDCG